MRIEDYVDDHRNLMNNFRGPVDQVLAVTVAPLYHNINAQFPENYDEYYHKVHVRADVEPHGREAFRHSKDINKKISEYNVADPATRARLAVPIREIAYAIREAIDRISAIINQPASPPTTPTPTPELNPGGVAPNFAGKRFIRIPGPGGFHWISLESISEVQSSGGTLKIFAASGTPYNVTDPAMVSAIVQVLDSAMV